MATPIHVLLSVAALGQGWGAAEIGWPAEPQIFTHWPFRGKVHLLSVLRSCVCVQDAWTHRHNAGGRGRKHCPFAQGITCTSESEGSLRHVQATGTSDKRRQLSSRLQAACRPAQSSYNTIININKIQLRKRNCSLVYLDDVVKSFTHLFKNHHVSLCARHVPSISKCQMVCLCRVKAIALLLYAIRKTKPCFGFT